MDFFRRFLWGFLLEFCLYTVSKVSSANFDSSSYVPLKIRLRILRIPQVFFFGNSSPSFSIGLLQEFFL